jgi:hypothetical protein
MGLGRSIYPPIREKIDRSRGKFKEFKEYCCGLVLFNAGAPLTSLENPDIKMVSLFTDLSQNGLLDELRLIGGEL